MADLIDRRVALDALGEEPLVWHEDDAGEVAERNQWRWDVAAIKALPSAQQWIPCSERLPGIGVTVLVWVYDDYYLSNLHSIDHVLYWDFDEFDLSGDEFGDVVAWSPLPEPWKGET